MKKGNLRSQLLCGLTTATVLSLAAIVYSPDLVAAEEGQADPLPEALATGLDESSQLEPSSASDGENLVDEEVTVPESNQQIEAETNPETDEEKLKAATIEPVSADNGIEIESRVINAANRANATDQEAITLEDQTLHMTEPGQYREWVEVGDRDTTNITWTINDQSLEDFKRYEMETGKFTGDPYLSIASQKQGNNLEITLTSSTLFGEDLSLREPNNIRRTYRDYIGDYLLRGENADGSLVLNKKLTLRPYPAYHSYEELVAAVEETTKTARTDRYVRTESYGESAQGRPLLVSTVAKDQDSVTTYLEQTTPLMLNNPEQLRALIDQGEFTGKVPILFHNTHADEQPGVDIVYGLYDSFARQEIIRYDTVDEDGNHREVVLDIPTLLDKFIFLFSFAENPDGVVNNTRVLANGFDPNRDTSYQTNPETRAVAGLINKWNPLTLIDFHGFVEEFLIEPTTPPHDPNFEYDLTSDTMMAHAHAMGRAGITNSKYEGYIIPKVDYGSGWDDAFSGYTAVYGLYHGILGHTVEIPQTNQDSYLAGYFAGLGAAAFADENWQLFWQRRLDFYSRGVNKVEDPRAEEELVAADGSIKGRPKNEDGRFFPDYYVIPMASSPWQSAEAAYEMIAYLQRNGVQVKELTANQDGFKKGDLVIDMAQAKRGYANHILYPGMNESDWDAMYAELVVNFPVMRGFTAEAIYQPGQFDGVLGPVTHTSAPQTPTDWRAPYHIIANNSLAAVRAVNQAIRSGHKVYASQDGFIVDTATYNRLLQTYPLYGKALYQRPSGETLQAYKIYSPNNFVNWMGHETPSEAANVLASLGFEIVNQLEAADVIVLDNARFDAEILGLKPTVVIGGDALTQLENLNVLTGFDAEMFPGGWFNEGLMHAEINRDLPLSSGFLANDYVYSTSGSWIEGIPNGFNQLVKIANEDYFISGWWPRFEELAGKTMAIDGQYNNQPLFIYAGNPLNRQHSHHFFRWISNAIFRGVPAQLLPLVSPGDLDDTSGEDPASNQPLPPHYQGDLADQADTIDRLPGFVSADQLTVVGLGGFASPNKEKVTENEQVQMETTLPATGNTLTYSVALGLILVVLGGQVVLVKRETR